jgi:hypothetical protein
MGLEEQLLTASIADTFHRAYKAIDNLERLEGRTATRREWVKIPDEEAHAIAVTKWKETLGECIDKAFRDVAILAERLGLPLLRQDIAKSRKAIEDLSQLSEDEDGRYHSEHLSEVHKFFKSLQCMTYGRAITGLAVFETVLHNTAKIIKARGIEPTNEAEIRKPVMEILRFCFHDVVGEVPIPKNFKVYKPDIGVSSLMAAAEYKFADSVQEAKEKMDGVYADMKGYSGSYALRSFYAVLYMTGPFYTQKDVEEEWRLVKAELSWTPIVVVGPGRRVSRARTRPRT